MSQELSDTFQIYWSSSDTFLILLQLLSLHIPFNFLSEFIDENCFIHFHKFKMRNEKKVLGRGVERGLLEFIN